MAKGVRRRFPLLIAVPLFLVLFSTVVIVSQHLSGLQPFEVGEDVVRRALRGDPVPYASSSGVDYSQLEALPDHAEVVGITVKAVPSFEPTYELGVQVQATGEEYLVTLLVREAENGWEIMSLYLR